ncbi:MAG TPA: XRE family transcriptional regulator [Gammaproteobacteria bacterium]|nr:XRE family transcriptional regulator [Gammaproteobacteria bacterium]
MKSEKEKFARRLNEALDDISYPRIGHGRQSALAKELKLSPQKVGSWLKGEEFPKTSQLVKISQLLDVRSNWLLSGVGSKFIKGSGQSYFEAKNEAEEIVVEDTPLVDKEAFELALAWLKLPFQQRVAIKKVILELGSEIDTE